VGLRVGSNSGVVAVGNVRKVSLKFAAIFETQEFKMDLVAVRRSKKFLELKNNLTFGILLMKARGCQYDQKRKRNQQED